MLNEDKLRLMTEIAGYAEREEKKELPAERYFRGDYVARHVLQSFFAWTLSFLLFASVAFLYSLNRILNSAKMADLMLCVRWGAGIYAAGLLLFELVTLTVYRRRYAAAVRRRRHYLVRINRLRKRYEIQERLRELAREGGRNA